jgi:hypothetical protein
MRGRWCFKRRFQRLIQDRDLPFKMWNLIIEFLICLYMSESIQMIKMLLKSFVILRGFKKNYISGKIKLLVYLIVKTICLGGI